MRCSGVLTALCPCGRPRGSLTHAAGAESPGGTPASQLAGETSLWEPPGTRLHTCESLARVYKHPITTDYKTICAIRFAPLPVPGP